jgi:hypothetical protein
MSQKDRKEVRFMEEAKNGLGSSHMCNLFSVVHSFPVPLVAGAQQTNKFRGLNPLANYIDQATTVLSAKLMTTSADRGCCLVSKTDPYIHIFGFL